jgi:hypothetical protein
MDKREDGGPAFGHGAENGHCCGATLRDWFAAVATEEDVRGAAQAFMAENGVQTCTRQEARYFHADAMLAERRKA